MQNASLPVSKSRLPIYTSSRSSPTPGDSWTCVPLLMYNADIYISLAILFFLFLFSSSGSKKADLNPILESQSVYFGDGSNRLPLEPGRRWDGRFRAKETVSWSVRKYWSCSRRSRFGWNPPRYLSIYITITIIMPLFPMLRQTLPSQGENCYKLCTSENVSALPMSCCEGQIITFRNNAVGYSGTRIELPNPKLLAVHAALARVADASGAFEYASAY